MLGDRTLIPQRLHQPVTGGIGIGQGFIGRKGLGRNDEKGRFRIKILERIDNMRAIDV